MAYDHEASVGFSNPECSRRRFHMRWGSRNCPCADIPCSVIIGYFKSHNSPFVCTYVPVLLYHKLIKNASVFSWKNKIFFIFLGQSELFREISFLQVAKSGLLIRLAEYRDAYFSWVTNFDLPVTNNISERSLRGCKTKMKVSGQFQVTESARNYAVIKTYLETCARNGINEMDALLHLCMGKCYSAHDVLTNAGCE